MAIYSSNNPLHFIEKPKVTGRFALKKGITYEDQFLYYGDALSLYAIRLRKGRKVVRYIGLIVSLVFALLHVAIFVLQFTRVQATNIFNMEYWGGPQALPLWFALFFLSFFVYRSMRKLRKTVPLEKKHGEKKQVHRQNNNISQSFLPETREVLEQAYLRARMHGRAEVSSGDIFYELLNQQDIAMVFFRLGIHAKTIQKRLQEQPGQHPHPSKEIGISSDVYHCIFYAYIGAHQAKMRFVGNSELLFATVLQSEILQELLYEYGVEQRQLEQVLEWSRIRRRLREEYTTFRLAASGRNKYGLDRAMTAVATPFLNKFSTDLTMAAMHGKLETCVAREKEIDEIFRIVESGRQSIVLVGEHGVGKRSIIQGIVQRMVEDDVPDRLKDKRLVQISVSALLAGTTMSGAQERLIRIMNEIARAGNIIVTINNIQDLMGAAGDAEGLDVSESLADYIGNGDVLVFATTTPEGHEKYIQNSQIGHVLTSVTIQQMTKEQAVLVLEAQAGYVEYKQKVYFLYDALDAAAEFASKFLYEQQLPESAMELLSEAASYVKSSKGENSLVNKDDIAHIIGQKTGVPVTSLTQDESTKLLNLEQKMHERVIGQHNAVVAVANALRRARVQIDHNNRPIANFLFLGSTGVGKTELAKTIADVYFGGENRMIRIDMSEYQDSSSVYRLIGEPGVQGSGQLTQAVRKQPFALILLDEMEKADPRVLDIFLQVFDDGRLTDSTGKTVDFSNNIIIATSNAGTSFIQEQMERGIQDMQRIQTELFQNELGKYFRPEFLNRFDGVVVFEPLKREHVKQIAALMLKPIAKELEEKGILFQWEESGLEALAKIGYDPLYGARPMRRAIQDTVENQLAELLLSHQVERRDTIVFDGTLKVLEPE